VIFYVDLFPKPPAFMIRYIAGCLLLFFFTACDNSGMPAPAGGDLPTNYIMVKDSRVSPSILTVVSGSSVTFVNNTAITHTIMTDDTSTIKMVSIAPGTSYFFKKDTSGMFPYHCTLHPSAVGVIILTP